MAIDGITVIVGIASHHIHTFLDVWIIFTSAWSTKTNLLDTTSTVRYEFSSVYLLSKRNSDGKSTKLSRRKYPTLPSCHRFLWQSSKPTLSEKPLVPQNLSNYSDRNWYGNLNHVTAGRHTFVLQSDPFSILWSRHSSRKRLNTAHYFGIRFVIKRFDFD